MEWLSFDGVNWIAVVLGTLAAFAVGATWYSKALFGKQWMGHVGKTEEELKDADGAGLSYGLTTVAAFATALLINVLMVSLGIDAVLDGAVFGAVLGLVFRLGTHIIHNGFALRSHALSLIDGAHDMVAMAAAGAIIAAFI